MSHVLVIGVFDLFHSGHVELLRRCKEISSRLTVLLNSDVLTEGYKRRPIMNDQERLSVVQSCRYVDHVLLAESLDVRKVIIDLGIQKIVHGDDWARSSYLKQIHCTEEFLSEHGTDLVIIPYTANISTSSIIKRCAERLG